MIVACSDFYVHTVIKETDESKCILSIEMRLKADISWTNGSVRKQASSNGDSLTCIWTVPYPFTAGSHVSWARDSFLSFQANAWTVPKLFRNPFLPYPLQFISHSRSTIRCNIRRLSYRQHKPKCSFSLKLHAVLAKEFSVLSLIFTSTCNERGAFRVYVVGSKIFRPDIQKPRQMENAVRDTVYSVIYGEVNVSVEKCVEIKGDYVEK